MNRRSKVTLVAVFAFATALLLFLSAGCGGRPERRFLLVGIDSADWSVIRPLLDEGKLPNIASLMQQGVSCPLRSLEPKQKSPVIWATIATGKLPDKHGINDYVDPVSKKLLTSNVRSARTFWDILGEAGTTVTVVGWLVSWPAEQVNGYMVTDYFRYPPREGRPDPEHLTYPENLVEEILELRVPPEAVSDADVDRFVDLSAALNEEEAKALPLENTFIEMRSIGELERRVSALKDILAGDNTFMAAARHLITRKPTDVCAVYLRGTDSASHRFWHCWRPDGVGFPVSQTERRVFGSTVELYYEYADEMLGELIAAFGDEATVMVCSDHGFEGPRAGRLPGGINDHGPVGILILKGPGIRVGETIPEQSVRDITPTILAMYGLPIGEDMDGLVVTEAFTDEFLSANPVRFVKTYEQDE